MTYPLSKCRFPTEVERIMQIALTHGVSASPLEAEKAWEEVSDDYCAQWLIVDIYTEKEVWNMLPNWFTGEESNDTK